MKHLGNCSYEEFMAAAVKMKEPLAKWLKETDAAGIRTRNMTNLPANPTTEESMDATRAFIAEMEIAAFRKCPDLTHELLGLATFTEYDDAHKGEYIDAALAMYADRVVRDFFTLSMRQSVTTSTTP